MQKIIDAGYDDQQLIIASEEPGRWTCSFGEYPEGHEKAGEDRHIDLVAIFRAFAMEDQGPEREDVIYPVEAMIFPALVDVHPDNLAKALATLGLEHLPDVNGKREPLPEGLQYDALQGYFSGPYIPLHAYKKADEADTPEPGLILIDGPVFPKDLAAFDSMEAALAYIHKKTGVLDCVFGLIGFILDRPVNRIGNDGWDLIAAMVEPERDLIRMALDRMQASEAATLRSV